MDEWTNENIAGHTLVCLQASADHWQALHSTQLNNALRLNAFNLIRVWRTFVMVILEMWICQSFNERFSKLILPMKCIRILLPLFCSLPFSWVCDRPFTHSLSWITHRHDILPFLGSQIVTTSPRILLWHNFSSRLHVGSRARWRKSAWSRALRVSRQSVSSQASDRA